MNSQVPVQAAQAVQAGQAVKAAALRWPLWLVLAASAGVFALTMGVRQTMGLFLGALNTSTGLGLGSISLAFAFGQLWWGLTQPFAGAMADKVGAGRVLLLVEDELVLRMSVARGLERQGWRVRQAPDGEAAMRRLAAERPAVMVSDIRMPGLDGIGLTEAARAMWPGLPVLLTSGYADEEARAAVPRLGVGFLAKPFTVRTLNERLREIV